MHNVLVIDDNDLITDMFHQALPRFGYSVTTASKGHEGLRLYEQGTFDLVITDILMPDMDGGTVVSRIRTSYKPRTPIIGMSGTPWLLKHNGFDHVLPKPFSLKSLLEAMKTLLPGQTLSSETLPYQPALNA
jgi:CheY-like chemotaxis protein